MLSELRSQTFSELCSQTFPELWSQTFPALQLLYLSQFSWQKEPDLLCYRYEKKLSRKPWSEDVTLTDLHIESSIVLKRRLKGTMGEKWFHLAHAIDLKQILLKVLSLRREISWLMVGSVYKNTRNTEKEKSNLYLRRSLRNKKRTLYVDNKSVRPPIPSVCRCRSVRDKIVCRILMKFGIGVIYWEFSSKREFCENLPIKIILFFRAYMEISSTLIPFSSDSDKIRYRLRRSKLWATAIFRENLYSDTSANEWPC